MAFCLNLSDMNLPKKNIFLSPEGYFEKLPEEILARVNQDYAQTRHWLWYGAAAAVVACGLLLTLLVQRTPESELNLEAQLAPEIEMYINAGHWQAEDILTFSDNPNDLLDAILLSEWGPNDAIDDTQEEWWF